MDRLRGWEPSRRERVDAKEGRGRGQLRPRLASQSTCPSRRARSTGWEMICTFAEDCVDGDLVPLRDARQLCALDGMCGCVLTGSEDATGPEQDERGEEPMEENGPAHKRRLHPKRDNRRPARRRREEGRERKRREEASVSGIWVVHGWWFGRAQEGVNRTSPQPSVEFTPPHSIDH